MRRVKTPRARLRRVDRLLRRNANCAPGCEAVFSALPQCIFRSVHLSASTLSTIQQRKTKTPLSRARANPVPLHAIASARIAKREPRVN